MIKKWILGLVLGATFTAVSAEPYMVASGGLARSNEDCSGVSSCDKNGIGFKLLGGYKLTPNLGIEGGYYNLGKVSAADSGVSMSIKSAGFGVGIAGFVDLAPQVRGFGRLGVASLKTKLDWSYMSLRGGVSDTNVALLFGLGAGYALTKNLSIDANVDFGKHKIDDNSFGGSSRV
jgi:OOP family OmpA-OmpF porin